MNNVDTQDDKATWPTNFWLVQALLIIIIAAAAFFAGRALRPEPKPDLTPPKPTFPENAANVQAAEKLLETAGADGKWTPEQDQTFRELLFAQPFETRRRVIRSYIQLINTGKLKRVRPVGAQSCPPFPAPTDPCFDVRSPAPAPGGTGGSTGTAAPPGSARGAK